MGKSIEQGGIAGEGVPRLEMLKSPEAESVFATMYDNLIASTRDKCPSTVLVCSASRGEGATTIASGLAIAASQRQSGDVLLLDCNTHNPAILKVFEEGKERFTSSSLQEERERLVLEATERYGCQVGAISRTPFARLTVLSTAKALKGHRHCLESLGFRKMLDELLQVFSFIVIDGPPANLHSESTFLSSQVDQVLLVLYSGFTRAPVAAKAAERLLFEGRPPKVVLNKRLFPIPPLVYRRL
jgi:Mrp family chromosome partitioning ATPase